MECKMFQAKPLGKCIGTVSISLNILEKKNKIKKWEDSSLREGQSQSRISAGTKTAVVLVPNYKGHKGVSLGL